MEFQAGQSGNPGGRPKGSYGGRIKALAALDRMLGKKKNQTVLMKALEKEFLNSPVRFFRTIVMPLLPRESKLKFDREGVIEWRSLVGASADSEQLAGGSGQSSRPLPGGSEQDVPGGVADGPELLGDGGD